LYSLVKPAAGSLTGNFHLSADFGDFNHSILAWTAATIMKREKEYWTENAAQRRQRHGYETSCRRLDHGRSDIHHQSGTALASGREW
jgi:hypothetical protein